MAVIYKMEWERFDTTIPWFEHGYKDSLYTDFFDKMWKDLVSSGKANKIELTESPDNIRRYLHVEVNSIESWEDLKKTVNKKFPNYFSTMLEYNITHGIFCLPENTGLSIDGGPLISDL